ncbi:MAG: M23 family metallopeptidase [Clostridia bacterium]|nr:M23 family metallopeptidase [Clostridia bacterium]
MKEQKEQKEKEKNSGKKKSWWNGERKFYLFTALGCAVALTAIIVVAVAVSNGSEASENQGGLNNGSNNEAVLPPDDEPSVDGGKDDDNDNEQVIVTPEGMVMPINNAVSTDYGFYYNQTINAYYGHKGMDFAAEAGTQVFAVDAGTVESIYKDDLLVGTEITIDHGDGVKSVYRFVDELEGLKVGDTVEKGEAIATVAAATGNEYRDGAHLHFEMYEQGVNIDPNVYLTLEEK